MSKTVLVRLFLGGFLLVTLSACGILGNSQPPPVVETLPPVATLPPGETAAPSPTDTPAAQVGVPPLVASPTPSPASNLAATETALPSGAQGPTETPWPYQVQIGMPRRMPNLFHGDGGCDWMGVGGQVLDVNGAPVQDFIVVEVSGRIAGLPVDELTAVGMAPAYGPAGFEITLANQPLGSTGALQIRLYDRDLNPLSAPVTFDTIPNCDENLILINFTANPASFPTVTPSPVPTAEPAAQIYLPVIMRDRGW